ncbi:MAG TPA: NAD-dependent epimerase/dehydratase family protein, partial [Candidatus Binatia bacterium]
MGRIVVTGGSGMLGREVIRELLARGFEVLSVDRAAPKQDACASAIV